MIIAEATRFPELARTWHRHARQRAEQSLGKVVRRLTERSLLAADDPELAAQHLNHLILAGPLDEAMFTARTTPFPRSRLHRWSDEAVRIFLAAYEPRRSTDGRQDPQAP